MKNWQKFFTTTLLVLTVTAAHSQIYGELTYISSKTKYSGAGITTESAPDSVGLYLGYELNENIAFEGLIGTGVVGSDVKLNGATQNNPVSVKVDYLLGAFLKPRYKLGDAFEAFVRLGYIEGKSTSSVLTTSLSTTRGDLVYGVGVNYFLNEKAYLTASWMDFYRKDNVNSDGWTFGVGYKF